MNPRRFFFGGLPASGKSTYLTAFWVYANGAPGGALSIETYPTNNKYLIELQKHWYSFTSVPRTPAQSECEVAMLLKRTADGAILDVRVPDLSGETFAQIWTGRSWSAQFQALVDGADGMVFFIHPKIEDGVTIEQARQAALGVEGEEGDVDAADDEEKKAEAPIAEFDPSRCPTEVQIVECLQLIIEYSKIRRPFRVAIVISAWDLTLKIDSLAEPSKWLGARLPLLAQFLESNGAIIESGIFGVSAQGGDYGTEKAELENKDPHKRCLVVGPMVDQETDVTSPIQWLTR